MIDDEGEQFAAFMFSSAQRCAQKASAMLSGPPETATAMRGDGERRKAFHQRGEFFRADQRGYDAPALVCFP